MPSREPHEDGHSVLVDFRDEEDVEGKVDVAFVERVLSEALTGRKLGGPFEVGVTITTDDGIRDLNSRYRGVDASTDVLSFPLLEFEHPEKPVPLFPSIPGEPTSLGDIVVSYPRAAEQAADYGHTLDREMAFLLVHGTMHLLGYDHASVEEEEVMRGEEETVLARLGLTREGQSAEG